jgi:solute carrier family 38 (sodium-coupled neutral amino acid transporter), member 11
MLVIIVTVITQGATVPSDLRGDLKGELFVNSGFFQAVGVISFGKVSLAHFAEFGDHYPLPVN